MAETVLSAVNRILQTGAVIQTNITALTANSQQQDVQGAIDALNEVIDDLTDLGAFPNAVSSGTITITTGNRSFPVAADFVELTQEQMVDQTNGNFLMPYPGGWDQLALDQLIPANFTGLPVWYVVDPTTTAAATKFYLNAICTASFTGRVYTYWYKPSTDYTTASAATALPCSDEAVRQMIPACVEVFNRVRRRGEYSEISYQKALSRAAGRLSRIPARKRYGPSVPMDRADSFWPF